MAELITGLLVLELFLFVLIDFYKYGTLYTPVFFLGTPFMIVLLVAVFVTSRLGFYSVDAYAVVVWCLGLFVFWASGNIFTFAAIKGKIVLPFHGFVCNRYVSTVIRCLSWLFLLLLFLQFVRVYRGVGGVGSDEFSDKFASHGLAAHCLSLMKFNAAYLCGDIGKRKQTVVIVLLTFVFLFIYNVKGGIILTALVCLFTSFAVNRSKFNVRKVLFIISIGVFFFVLSYAISLGEIDLYFIVFHFLTYIVAGVVGLSQHLVNELPVDIDYLIVIQPVANLVRAVAGIEVVDRVSDYWVVISTVYSKQSNVKTFFGDIFIYAGFIKGLLLSSFFGLASYFFLVVTIVNKTIVYLVLYFFLASSLMLGWFNFYFNDLFYYEVVVYVVCVVLVSSVGSYCSGYGYTCRSRS